MKRRIQLNTVIELPDDLDFTDEQLHEWAMANLGWNHKISELPSKNPLRSYRMVAEDPQSTVVKVI